MSMPDDQVGDLFSEEDLSGRQLGDYRLLRRLGRGAMAVVYLAEQCSLNRQVALKVLRNDLVDDETYVRRFQREARAVAALVHANIVQIHEVGQIDRVYFIAQEFVEGQNLRTWIHRNEKPDLPHILSIMLQVTAALAKAGGQGVVHRDIKPENILLTRSGEVKVADFGLARLSNQGDPVELTQVGITLGTPLYMSPEQVEGKPLDPRSDVYSFGVTCYHMIAGSPPFTGETPLSVAVQHLKKEPEPLQNLRSDLPRQLCDVVHRMLAKEPRSRYQSAAQLLQELRRIQREHLGSQWPEDLPGWETSGVDASSFGPVQATQRLQAVMETAALSAHHGRRWRWPVALAVACLVGAATAWFAIRPTLRVTPAPAGPRVVERKKDIFLQYLQATRLNTPEAWQAVVEFTEATDGPYVNRAKQQLIRLHLDKGNFDLALPLCNDLIALDASKEELRGFGFACRAIALNRVGDYAGSAEALDSFRSLSVRLPDGHIRNTLQVVEKGNQEAMNHGSR
ncbi:MAG TPA: serine/threonine protein kinase [Planctomycetaceae bacterium]|nr:serine/threonine protein kinase [Planctomycetaceae bacterium]